MKDSGIEWIGEIPEGWEVRKIKSNFAIYAGATPKSEKTEYWDGGIPWITPADFKTTDKYASYGRKSLTSLGYDSCGTTLVPAGSIIFQNEHLLAVLSLPKMLCVQIKAVYLAFQTKL